MGFLPRKLRTSLDRLKEGEPGKRFQEHYRQRQHDGAHAVRRWFYLGGGTIVILAGIFFLPAPGPGFLIIFLGGGLVAQESLVAAKALDWVELRLRRVASWALRIWKRSPVPMRALIVLVGVACIGAAGYGTFWLMFMR